MASTPSVAQGQLSGVRAAGRWLLLIHQLPPEPAYLRVKVRRQLQRIGALPLKNSVYVLPNRDESLEDFQWLRRMILDDGGEATVSVADFLEGATDEGLEDQFRNVSRAAYSEFVKTVRQSDGGEKELHRLRSQLDDLAGKDWFGAPGRSEAERTLDAIASADSRDSGAAGLPSANRPKGATWVTRRDVHVDRMASAWLIRRFIDPSAHFRFVDADGKTRRGELRFDMFDGEYTHEGDRCTFQTLVARFGVSRPALEAIGEIVHDIDYKIETSARPETGTIRLLINGICLSRERDEDRIEAGRALFDSLYADFDAKG